MAIDSAVWPQASLAQRNSLGTKRWWCMVRVKSQLGNSAFQASNVKVAVKNELVEFCVKYETERAMIRKWVVVWCNAEIRYKLQCWPVEISLSSRNGWACPAFGVEFLGAKQGIVWGAMIVALRTATTGAKAITLCTSLWLYFCESPENPTLTCSGFIWLYTLAWPLERHLRVKNQSKWSGQCSSRVQCGAWRLDIMLSIPVLLSTSLMSWIMKG